MTPIASLIQKHHIALLNGEKIQRNKRKQKSLSKSWTKEELKTINTAKSEASEMVLTRTVQIASDHTKFFVTHRQNIYGLKKAYKGHIAVYFVKCGCSKC